MPRKPVYKTDAERTAARTESHRKSMEKHDWVTVRVYMKPDKKGRLIEYQKENGFGSLNECVNKIIDEKLDNI